MENPNSKIQISNKFRIWKLFVIWGLVIGAFPLATVWAHAPDVFWTPGEPLVPCGGTLGICVDSICTNNNSSCTYNVDCGRQPPCNRCELLHLIRHVIDFILVAAAPVLATLFFILAGLFIMLGGGNPGSLAKGKKMFRDTFIGILIVMLAWLITNTLIRSIAEATVRFSDGTPWTSANWWRFDCPWE